MFEMVLTIMSSQPILSSPTGESPHLASKVECGSQVDLNGDDAVLNLLKATMPTELFGTLYSHDNLYTVMTMLKDIYAKKPQNNVAAVTGAAQGATAPFTHICSPTRGAPKAQSDASLEDRILQLTETLYRIDMNGKPP